MDRSDQYRHFAQECLEMARASESEQTRVILLQMAQVWFRLAGTHTTAEARAEAKTERDGGATEPSD